MDSISDFFAWEQVSRDTIDVKRIYIDITNDLIAGILLSQIIYWYLPNKEGKTKLRVKKENSLWLAKGRFDWWEECRISAKQFDRAFKILENKGIVIKKVFKFNGNPTTHIKLNLDVLLIEIKKELSKINAESEKKDLQTQQTSVITQRVITKLPKGEERNIPKGNNETTQRGRTITENTTENTNIDYIQSVKSGQTDKDKTRKINNSNNNFSESKIDFEENQRTYLKIITDNIGYYSLNSYIDKNLADDFIRVMIEYLTEVRSNTITINKQEYSLESIKSRLLKLNQEHFQHAIFSFSKTETTINNKNKYILACLFNAYTELNAHDTNIISRDFGFKIKK